MEWRKKRGGDIDETLTFLGCKSLGDGWVLTPHITLFNVNERGGYLKSIFGYSPLYFIFNYLLYELFQFLYIQFLCILKKEKGPSFFSFKITII